MLRFMRTSIFFSVLSSAMIVSACVPSATMSTPATQIPEFILNPVPSFAGIVSKIITGIVYIYVDTNETDSSGAPVAAAGSGVILSSDGWILTNRHVVNNYKSVEVTLEDHRTYTATKVLMDDVIDLAVVKIDEQGLNPLNFGDPDSINVGDWVIAIGHALGISPQEGGPTVTEGIVSSLGRSFTIDATPYYDLVQTSAAINPGNSGGALVNTAGEIIGINSAGVTTAQNIGYAINVGTARHVFEDLVQYGKPQHPYLGVRLVDMTTEMARKVNGPLEGALVDFVEPGSPADAAGLRVDDVIVSLGGETITSASDVMKVLWRQEPGQTASIVYLHRGLENNKDVQFVERPQTSSI